MNIYLISQTENNGYDTYDSAVVFAKTSREARMINPHFERLKMVNPDAKKSEQDEFTWCKPYEVIVEFIGTANDKHVSGIVCSSYNAG